MQLKTSHQPGIRQRRIPCHPERSTSASEASRRAQSKDRCTCRPKPETRGFSLRRPPPPNSENENRELTTELN